MLCGSVQSTECPRIRCDWNRVKNLGQKRKEKYRKNMYFIKIHKYF